MSPWSVHQVDDYDVAILESDGGLEARNDNVDIEVRFRNGDRYGATFFTLQNIEALMSGWAATGECSSGLYFAVDYPVIVRELTTEVILAVVADMHRCGELTRWFERLGNQPTDSPEGLRP